MKVFTSVTLFKLTITIMTSMSNFVCSKSSLLTSRTGYSVFLCGKGETCQKLGEGEKVMTIRTKIEKKKHPRNKSGKFEKK